MAQLKIFNLPNILTQSSLPSLSLPGYIQSFRASSSPHANKVGDALEILQQYADSINTIIAAIISQLQAASVTVTGSTGIFLEEYTLNAATFAITLVTPPTLNSLLIVVLVEDATGGRQITWPATVKWASVEIATTAGTVSVYLFFGRTDPVDSTAKWFPLLPTVITGQTP